MAFRLYIVPVVGDGSKEEPRRPKYFADGGIDADFSAMDYGFEPWMVVGADLSVSNDAFVVGQEDGMALPFDLAPNLTTQQVNGVQDKLEAINVPAGWVNTSLSWLEVVRSVLGMFSFMQRLSFALGGRIFGGSVTLATTLGQLSQPARDKIQETADSFGLDTSAFTGGTTIRAALKSFADQFGEKRYNFNGTIL